MLLTITLIVLLGSFLVFFSQELGAKAKKVFSLWGVNPLVPLFVASLLIAYYETAHLTILLRLKTACLYLTSQLAAHLPLQSHAVKVSEILGLFICASLPVWVSTFKAKRKSAHHRVWPHAFVMGLTIWLILAILITVNIANVHGST